MSKLPGDGVTVVTGGEVTVVTGDEVTGEGVSVVCSEPLQFPVKDEDIKFLNLPSVNLSSNGHWWICLPSTKF